MPANFGSEVFPSDTLETIAAESDAESRPAEWRRKTTLLRSMLGAVHVFNGRMQVDGHAADGAGARVGYVQHVETLDGHFPVTVEEVVMMGLADGFFGMYLSYFINSSSGATIVLLGAPAFALALIYANAREFFGRMRRAPATTATALAINPFDDDAIARPVGRIR